MNILAFYLLLKGLGYKTTTFEILKNDQTLEIESHSETLKKFSTVKKDHTQNSKIGSRSGLLKNTKLGTETRKVLGIFCLALDFYKGI